MKKIIAAFFCGATIGTSAQVCFSSSQSVNSAAQGHSITMGDFNEDGNMDVVTPYGSYSVSISLGTGTGHFNLPTICAVAGQNLGGINGLTSADFNEDGHLDIATVNSAANISFLAGSGNGTFGSFTTYTLSSSIGVALKSADFNGDGHVDLASLNNNANNISVVLGNGMGAFGPSTDYAAGNNPYELISADFNNDGNIDLAAVNAVSPGYVAVLLGTGTGSFATYKTFSVADGPDALVSGDFNGDSKVDIATYNITYQNISVILGDGSGGFGNHVDYSTGLSGSGFAGICAGDFNLDNKIDLAAVGSYDTVVSVLTGNGSGAFNGWQNIQSGCVPAYVASADLNNDGMRDLVFPICDSVTTSPFNAVLLNCATPPACIASVTDSLFNISPLNWGIVPHYSSQVTSAVWNWGDGTTSNGLYPSHTYASAGWYNICVTVYTSCGDSASACRSDSVYRTASSSMVNVTVMQSANAINSAGHTSKIIAFPNPFNNEIKIRVEGEQGRVYKYILRDIVGRMILEGKCVSQGDTKLDAEGLNKGSYIVSVLDENGDKTSYILIK